jgi:Flp pilus assembly protein TadD
VPTFESSGCNGNVRALEQRDTLVRWGRRVGIVVAAVALSYGGYRGYGIWRTQHLEKQVRQFVSAGEYQSAVLVARRLLDLNADNLTASRAMAEMAERSGRVEAVQWRKRIAQLEPNVPANQLALIKAALGFGQTDLARHILSTVAEPARKSVDYHQLAAALALTQQDRTKAEAEFRAALALEPNNRLLALNVAALQLTSQDPANIEQGRADLAALTADAAVRLPALRALAGDAVARKDLEAARNWATQLHADPRADFADELLHFRAVEGTDLASHALEALKTKAAAKPNTAAELITWLNRNGMAVVALDWSSRLPKEIAEAQPVPLAIAEAYSFMQDWPGLQALVEGKNWGEFEGMRLAVESHALHRLSPSERPSMHTQTVWRAALKAAEKQPAQLIAIAQLAEGWGYRGNAEEAWWMIANSNENSKAGLSALQRLYRTQLDTRGLLKVAKRALELNPLDVVAANNCASLGLLLSGDSTARRLAAKLHTEHPKNRAFAATYAYALHTEGKYAEGLEVIERLKDQELRHPAIAAYYVVMLTDNGKLEQARSFLGDANRATLLPEEQKLLATATRKLLAAATADLPGVAAK